MNLIEGRVYYLIAIAIGSFLFGHVLVRYYLRTKGVSKKYKDLVSSLVTMVCLIIGFALLMA